MMSEMLKSPNRNQINKVPFLHMFCDFFFFLKSFIHFWHCHASTVFFTWIIIWIRLNMSCSLKQFLNEMIYQKTFAKTASICLGFQVGDLNNSDIYYRIQNFIWWPVFSIITHWTYTCLSPWALTEKKGNNADKKN